MNIQIYIRSATLLAAAAGMSACVTRPPSIAHVHIGHALTGVHVTPDHKGYILLAERRADETLEAVKSAAAATDLPGLKSRIAVAVSANDSQENFGVKQSLIMAANHIAFAATEARIAQSVLHFGGPFLAEVRLQLALDEGAEAILEQPQSLPDAFVIADGHVWIA